MSFQDFGLLQELVDALTDKGYEAPTPIQQQSIPAILEGGDLLAAAQTGTGKTAGFTVPLLQNLMKSKKQRAPFGVRALILTPTRELAAQVEESVKTYGKHLPLKSAVVFGGVNINPQMRTLEKGVDILVATPGRLLDLVAQKAVLLSSVETLVLDEADRMLDMGFIHDIRRVLALLPKKRQNLLFSATFSDEIKTLASGFLHAPQLIEVAKSNSAATGVEQLVHPVDHARKRELLSFLIQQGKWQQVLVFMRTKHGANRLTTQLEEDGITALAIHGNKSQGARTKALAEFKTGKIRVLVATDIAARGLDIDQLPQVVNFDLPNVPEDYVHRIGRTARAGREGTAISLVCIDEHKLLRDIERLMKKEVPKKIIAGFEPNPAIAAQPIPNGRNQRQGRDHAPSRSHSRDTQPRAAHPRSFSSGRSQQPRQGSRRSGS